MARPSCCPRHIVRQCALELRRACLPAEKPSARPAGENSAHGEKELERVLLTNVDQDLRRGAHPCRIVATRLKDSFEGMRNGDGRRVARLRSLPDCLLHQSPSAFDVAPLPQRQRQVRQRTNARVDAEPEGRLLIAHGPIFGQRPLEMGLSLL